MDKPFALLYELPGREKEFIFVNEERYELLPEKFNQFIVEVLTKEKGWAKFELAVFDEDVRWSLHSNKFFSIKKKRFFIGMNYN